MKSFSEFVLEQADPLSPEDRKSLETETGAFYHGVRHASAFPGRSPLNNPHTFVHSETGEEVRAWHPKAKRISAENMTNEQKAAFERGHNAELKHEFYGPKDVS